MGRMMVEATNNEGHFIDVHTVRDESDVLTYLDSYLDHPVEGDLPMTLDYLSEEGDLSGTQTVIWLLVDGVPQAWRTVGIN